MNNLLEEKTLLNLKQGKLISEVVKNMNHVLQDYLEKTPNVKNIQKFCQILVNPKSKHVIQNFMKTNDFLLTQTKPNCANQRFRSQNVNLNSTEMCFFKNQNKSIDKLKKRILKSRFAFKAKN